MIARRTFLAAAAASLAGGSRVARAQPAGKVYRVGVLSPAETPIGAATFIDGMRALGYIDGRNVVYERRFASGRLERLPELAADLVRIPVDVIVVAGPGPLRAATNATKTIPIVMMASSSDPVGEGVAASLARPGGNVTGLTYAESSQRFGKQLEFLKEAAPGIVRVAVWWDMAMTIYGESWAAPLEGAARKLGLAILPPVQVLSRDGIDGAFAAFRQRRADALLVTIGGPTSDYRGPVAAAALRNRLPTVAAFKEFTEAGGLVSYGPDFFGIYRRAAYYADRILKGTPAGEIPIELPKYELAVNVATAKALGLPLPQSLLLRADKVYR